jgi:hypothetical protein
MQKKLVGITLLETMLVLAIMASFLLFGINRLTDASITVPAGNVPRTTIGALSPESGAVDYTLSNQAYAIDIKTNLIKGNYLSKPWPTFVPAIDSTYGLKGYSASFIFLLTTKNAYACWNFTNTAGAVKCTTAQPIQPQQVAFWLAQVSVKIANDPKGDKTLAFLGPTGASCASSVPDKCDGSKSPNYLIWQQLPTKSGSNIGSDLWESQSQEAMFNQQYTHDVIYEMTTPAYSTNPAGDIYYLCGS